MRTPAWVACLALAIAPCGAAPSAETVVIDAARVCPVSGAPIERGRIVVRGGKIAAVGETARVEGGGPDALALCVPGWVVPGLIDCGSTLGVRGRAADEWRELTPDLAVADSLDLDDPALRRALRSGVTAAAVSPGARNVIGGLGAVIRTIQGARREDAVIARDAFLDVSLSDEAASGNRDLRGSRPSTYSFRLPTTRMGVVFLVRRSFQEALGAPVGDEPSAPAPLPTADPELAALRAGVSRMLEPAGSRVVLSALRGALPLRIRAGERQEIETAFRVLDEFGSTAILVGAQEARGLAPELARRGLRVLVPPGADDRALRPESFPEYAPCLPAVLTREGVPFAFASGRGDDVPLLLERVRLAIRLGLGEDAALEALTLGAARILGIDGRTGSIEAGKEADLVAFDGDPFDVRSRILWVMVSGRRFVVVEEEEL